MKDKYIITDVYQMNAFYREGYEFLFVFEESYSNVSYEAVAGQFMGNSVSLNIPHSRKDSNTKVVMQLTKPAEVLYGEKRENNS